jgi:uroporphyrinogen decarboxylase
MNNINYKNIFEKIVNHEKGNWFLLDFGGDQASVSIFSYKKFLEKIGVEVVPKINSFVQLSALPEEIFLKKFNVGLRWLYPKPSRKMQALLHEYADVMDIDVASEIEKGYVSSGKGKSFKDEWDVVWKRSAYYFEMIRHPLAGMTFEEIKKYKFPDPEDSARILGLEEEVDQYRRENINFVVALSQSYGGILETALWLRGFSDFYMDIASNNRECAYLLDSITEYFIAWNQNYLGAVGMKADILAVGDDYGMQDRTILSPDLWRKQIKPRYARLIENAKSRYKHLRWFHHSCGSIFPIIDDMIAIGIDILNPIQPLAKDMQPEKLKKAFGKRIVFHGGIDIQKLLPFADPDTIKKEVRRIIEILSEDGGYIVAPTHNIQALTPPENICAFYDTVNEMFTLRSQSKVSVDG